MSFTRSLLLVTACFVLFLQQYSAIINAQDLTGLTKCASYGNHFIQWNISTRADGTPYLRARYIKKGGYNGWAAFGFRYGYAWSYPVADPDNQSQPEKMGEYDNPSTIYMVYRNPQNDVHNFYEMMAYSSDLPSNVAINNYATTNATVRSIFNETIHLYLERDLIAKNGVKNYFNFNASRTDCNLMFASSDKAIITSINDFANSQHNFAKILKYNLISETGIDAGSISRSCSDAVYSSAMPPYRPPKNPFEPSPSGSTPIPAKSTITPTRSISPSKSFGPSGSTPLKPTPTASGNPRANVSARKSLVIESDADTATYSHKVFVVAYLMGALILGLFAYF